MNIVFVVGFSSTAAAITWDSQELTESNAAAGSGTQWWFDHFNWSDTGNTPGSEEAGFLPPSSDNTGAGPTDTQINTGTDTLPGGEGVVYYPHQQGIDHPNGDPNFDAAGSLLYPSGYGRQVIHSLYLSRNTTADNLLTIKGDLTTGNIQIGKSSGQVGVANNGKIVQLAGLVKVVNQALDIAQSDTTYDGFGNGTYDYRGGSLEVSLTGGSGIRLAHGSVSPAPSSLAGAGGQARFIMHNPASPGYVKTGSVAFGSFAGTQNGTADVGDPNGVTRGVSTIEFHYENGGTRPIQVTGGLSLNNGFSPNHGSTRSSRLELVLHEAPCGTSGCVPPNLGLFDIGGSLTGTGDLDGDGTTNNDRVFSDANGVNPLYPSSRWAAVKTSPNFTGLTDEDFLLTAPYYPTGNPVHGGTLFRWRVHYTGTITFSDPNSSTVSSVSDAAGSDIVLIGHSSLAIPGEGIPGDINEDGLVNILDYAVGRMEDPAGTGTPLSDWAANFDGSLSGSGSEAGGAFSNAVPEPSAAVLVAFSAFACGLARRKR